MGIKITFSANCHIPEGPCSCKRCRQFEGKEFDSYYEFRAMIYSTVSSAFRYQVTMNIINQTEFNKEQAIGFINTLIRDLRIDQEISINSVFKEPKEGDKS